MRRITARRLPALILLVAAVAVIALLVLAARAAEDGAQAAGPPSPDPAPAEPTATGRPCPGHAHGLRWYRQRHDVWRSRLGDRLDRASRERPAACTRVIILADRWRDRAAVARRAFARWFDRTYAKWRCVHEHEAPPWSRGWRANTGNGYYGGLQMDLTFQRAYGPSFLARWGTADRWPIWAQLRAAEAAAKTRGWNPWPNTARACGLL